MVSRFGRFGLACLLVGGSGAVTLASFPEPDFVVYGLLNGASVAEITATWSVQGAVAQAEDAGNGFYIVRVPVDDATASAGGGRVNAAHFGAGESVKLLRNATELRSFALSRRGQVERLDLGGTGPASFRRGDADQNGTLELTDAINILGHLFLGTVNKVPDCKDAADADDNNTVELTDAIRILGFLFLGQAPVAPPGPMDCGSDPTADDLGVCVYALCPGARGGGEIPAGGGGGGVAAVLPIVEPAPFHTLAAVGLAVRDARRSDLESSFAGKLEVFPAHVRFGAVKAGSTSTKTVLIRNHGNVDAALEVIVSSSPSFAPLHDRVTVPARGEARLGILYAPAADGLEQGVLTLAPGLEVALDGTAKSTGPAAILGDVLVASSDWTPGAAFLVPVLLDGFPEGSQLQLGVHSPLAGLTVLGVYRREEIPTELTPPAGSVLALRVGETGCRAFALLRVDGLLPLGPSAIFPLWWESLSVDAESGSVDLQGTHGEVVIGAALLDLDGDLRTSLSADLVYASRRQSGLSPVPATFEAMLAGEARVSAACWDSLDRLGPVRERDAPGTALADLDLVVARLLGAETNDLGPLSVARLDHLTRPHLRPHSGGEAAAQAAPEDRGAPVSLTMTAGDAEINVETRSSEPISGLRLLVEVSTASCVLEARGADTTEAIVGRDAATAQQWHVLFQDRLGERWFGGATSPPGRLRIASPDAPAEVQVRIVRAEAARGPRPVRTFVPGTTMVAVRSVPLPARNRDCDGNGAFDMNDVLFLARYVVADGPRPARAAECDGNGDGHLDLGDVLQAARRILANDP